LFLIVCEGEVTERLYFTELGRRERAVVELVILSAGVPKSVVERAVKMKREAETRASGSKNSFLTYDEVWCVFDVDEHPKIEEAKQQARANGLEVAISNPCFELWALLHFQDKTAHVHRRKVQGLCRKHMPGYEKVFDYALLEKKYADALRRATQLDHIHKLNGCPGSNPSTGAHRVVAAIKQKGQGIGPG
jgi:hypothetical protein